MPKTTLFAAAALALGIGGALAASSGFDQTDDATQSLSELQRSHVEAHASRVFERADLDKDGAISSDEYAALSVAVAGLSHLNGFAAVETDDGVVAVSLPANASRSGIDRIERIRIDARARRQFYKTAGEDGLLQADEFATIVLSRFDAADRNNDGVLRKNELAGFALLETGLRRSAV